eukprot:TRINITY_DN7426_c4_g1_i1.p1 TRINITY_DN7426_c4_g1~~TRINITY_DN7426_c4_g1_i1.p1  ORF type:complete len:870 (+),score=248.14 TRINITY_DN7426_c4_g1_i1:91-2700(+)
MLGGAASPRRRSRVPGGVEAALRRGDVAVIDTCLREAAERVLAEYAEGLPAAWVSSPERYADPAPVVSRFTGLAVVRAARAGCPEAAARHLQELEGRLQQRYALFEEENRARAGELLRGWRDAAAPAFGAALELETELASVTEEDRMEAERRRARLAAGGQEEEDEGWFGSKQARKAVAAARRGLKKGLRKGAKVMRADEEIRQPLPGARITGSGPPSAQPSATASNAAVSAGSSGVAAQTAAPPAAPQVEPAGAAAGGGASAPAAPSAAAPAAPAPKVPPTSAAGAGPPATCPGSAPKHVEAHAPTPSAPAAPSAPPKAPKVQAMAAAEGPKTAVHADTHAASHAKAPPAGGAAPAPPPKQPAGGGAAAQPKAPAQGKAPAGGAPAGPPQQTQQQRNAAVHRAVASAGVSAGVLGAAQAFRRNWQRREQDTIERPDQEHAVVDGVVLPVLTDAAIASATASGTALLVAQASEATLFQASGAFASVGQHMGGVVTGLFTAVGVGSALHQWGSGVVSTRDLKKTLTKAVWGIGAGAGIVVAAGASVSCAAALAAGTAALDLTGATDGVVDQLWGRDRRAIRVALIKQYAKVLGTAPTATDDEMRKRYQELQQLLESNKWGGTEADEHVLHHTAARLLLLRGEARSKLHTPPPTPDASNLLLTASRRPLRGARREQRPASAPPPRASARGGPAPAAGQRRRGASCGRRAARNAEPVIAPVDPDLLPQLVSPRDRPRVPPRRPAAAASAAAVAAAAVAAVEAAGAADDAARAPGAQDGWGLWRALSTPATGVLSWVGAPRGEQRLSLSFAVGSDFAAEPAQVVQSTASCAQRPTAAPRPAAQPPAPAEIRPVPCTQRASPTARAKGQWAWSS